MFKYNAFFYGTLMHPKILKHIIVNDGSHLHLCPAVLQEYTRHRVKGEEYPGIIPSLMAEKLVGRPLSPVERYVRGTLVTGLNRTDIAHLDDFEGMEYKRIEVEVHSLADFVAVSDHTGGDDELILLHGTPVPAAEDLATPVKADTYIYKEVEGLEPELWSFDDFVRKDAVKWFNYQTERPVKS